MSDIATIQSGRQKEVEEKRNEYEVKKLKSQNYANYTKLTQTKAQEEENLQKDYETKIGNLKNELEQKLMSTREKNNELAEAENKRMEEELANLRKVHDDQVNEIKVSQRNEIANMEKSHRNTIDNSRQKFQKEKMKWKAS